MKTTNMKQILAVALVALSATTAYANSWRINNNGSKAPDFADLNAAMTSESVVEGDTLYLDPGCVLSSEQNVTKQVTIVGTGYDSTKPYGISTISGNLVLNAAYIKVEGVYITGEVKIQYKHATIERCKMTNKIWHSDGGTNYTTIRQCYIDITTNNNAIVGSSKTATYNGFWTIENCIIRVWTNYTNNCISKLFSATIRNNLIIHKGSDNVFSDLGQATVVNNIVISSSATVTNFAKNSDGQFSNNVFSQAYQPETNKTGYTDINTVLTGNYESYTLTEDSPAAGYGLDGTDCGIFGGLYPYVKGGLPYGHPYYTKTTVSPRAENDKVNVSLQIKMQNE